jgi:hypothetical protein
MKVLPSHLNDEAIKKLKNTPENPGTFLQNSGNE